MMSPDASRIEIRGDLDLLTAPMVIAAARLSDGRSDLTINLTHLRFIDCAGISAFVFIHRELHATSHHLRVDGASARILRTFTLARAQWLLPVSDPDVLSRLAAAIVQAVMQQPQHPAVA